MMVEDAIFTTPVLWFREDGRKSFFFFSQSSTS